MKEFMKEFNECEFHAEFMAQEFILELNFRSIDQKHIEYILDLAIQYGADISEEEKQQAIKDAMSYCKTDIVFPSVEAKIYRTAKDLGLFDLETLTDWYELVFEDE